MRTILGLVALALLVAGCTATTPASADKTQQTHDERNRESQGGGSY